MSAPEEDEPLPPWFKEELPEFSENPMLVAYARSGYSAERALRILALRVREMVTDGKWATHPERVKMLKTANCSCLPVLDMYDVPHHAPQCATLKPV